MPVPAPSMPCFAERYLYVTTLRHGRDPDLLARYPTMGGLFRLAAPVAGAPVGLFADD
jgi:sugar lactone lactonase YvrE